MATTKPSHRSIGTTPGSPAPLFGIFSILWILFAAALIFNQAALNNAWDWFTGLPVILQLISWILFLPITLGLWVWVSDWALWLRLLLVIMIGAVNLTTLKPRNSRRRGIQARDSDDQTARLRT